MGVLLYVWPVIHGNHQNTVMKWKSYLTAAVIVTVPFLVGVFGICHIVASSHDS